MSSLPRLLVLVGPTASGKTDMSLALARAFSGEILSADSRTVYRGMDIGTAKPLADTLVGTDTSPSYDIRDLFAEKPRMHGGIPHWGFDMYEPSEVCSAAEYQEYADKKIAEILARGNLPILVGGTGLYVAAVLDRPSFAQVPPDPGLRLELATKTNEELVEEIAERDPDTAERIDVHNRRRLERAIEMLRGTGKRLAEVQARAPARYDALQLGVRVARDELNTRIDARVDAMVAQGLIDEVRMLRDRFGDDAPGMTGIGYRQICAFLRGEMSLRDALVRIKHDTRQYAKRQMTWFARDARIVWVENVSEALARADAWLREE